MGWRLMGAAEENSCQCCVPSREIKMCLCRDSNSVSGALATVPPTTSNACCVVRLRRHFGMQAFGWLHKQIWTLMSHGKIFSSSSLSMSLFKKKIWFSRKLIWALFLTCIIAETGVIPSLISSQPKQQRRFTVLSPNLHHKSDDMTGQLTVINSVSAWKLWKVSPNLSDIMGHRIDSVNQRKTSQQSVELKPSWTHQPCHKTL